VKRTWSSRTRRSRRRRARRRGSSENNHGGRKRILIARATRREESGRMAYIAGIVRLRSCLPSGTELGTKQLGSQWDHISTTASVGRNKMASAIRLLFHPRGRDRPYFILLPRPRSSKRTPCSLSVVQSANRRRKSAPCFFPASCVKA